MTWIFNAVVTTAGAYLSYKGAQASGDAKLKGQEAAMAAINEATAKAEDQIFKLVSVGEQNLLTGTQGALNVLGQSVGPTMDLSRGGNIAAQETLLAGMPQVEAALRGQPVDYSQFQVYEGAEVPEIDYQLPEFEDTISEELMAGTEAEQEAAAIKKQADDTVNALYMEVFGREPDASGMAWARSKILDHRGLVAPGKVAKLKNKMMKSDEYKDKNPAVTSPMLGANITVGADWTPVTDRKGLS